MPGMPDASSRLTSNPTQEALQARIDELGFGKFQVFVLLCTGGVMMSEGSEMLIMGSITSMLEKDWGLSSFTKGFMVSIVFVGFALGNLLSGAIGDRYGRRPTIMLSYFIIGVAGFLTSEAMTVWVMVLLRFLVGAGCGVGFPSIYTLIPEVCPTKLRGAVCACMIGFMPLGEIYASFGVVFIDRELAGLHTLRWHVPLPHDSWRRLCQFSAVPSLFFFGACLTFLKESPFFLARQGRLEEANAVLESMAYWNGKPFKPLELAGYGGAGAKQLDAIQQTKAEPFSWSGAVSKCMSERYFATTLVMFAAHFTKDFSVFGLNYVFPQYFTEVSSAMAPGWQMLLISFIALPGVLVAVLITQNKSIGNITSMSALAFCSGLLSFGMVQSLPVFLHMFCAPMLKFAALAYFIVVVVYTAEVFPTAIRNSAVGLCTCAGRAGSISAPLAFELSSGFNFFWYMLVACMWTVAIFARIGLTMETKGKPLVDDESGGKPSSYKTVNKV